MIVNRNRRQQDHLVRGAKRENKFTTIPLDLGEKPTALKAVFRTANILNCLSEGIGSVTEIATLCGLNKSKVHKLLTAMCEAKLALLDPVTHQYLIGPLINKIATDSDVTHEILVTCASDEIEYLADFTGESVGMAVLSGFHGISVYEVDSKSDHKVVGKNKVISDLHAGGGAKVMLSELSQKNLKIALANMELRALTEHTVTDKDELIAQLNQIRRQGYAVSYSERIPDAMDISAPVKGYPVPVTLTILGPASRMKPRKDEFTAVLRESVARIETNLEETYRIE